MSVAPNSTSSSQYSAGASQADDDLNSSTSNRDAGEPTASCPLAAAKAGAKTVVLIPRKPANLWVGTTSGAGSDYHVCRLLPDRYAPKECGPIKDIERNFYPDLKKQRTITAVVTETGWNPQEEARTVPKVGTTVYFRLGPGTTAGASLSSATGTTDADGCATVTITVDKLQTTKAEIEAAAKIELIANIDSDGDEKSDTLVLTIHRNEDVDVALGDAESPDDFAASLAPVRELKTWLVKQAAQNVTSNGVKAVQQLINQVLCRKRGDYPFQKPDGQYGTGLGTAVQKFIDSFGAKPVTPALTDYERCRFGVKVEEESSGQGIEKYVKAEYGAYSKGMLVDGHLLEGLQPWAAGGAIAGVSGADGLLDLHRAVVWPFLTHWRERCEEYVTSSLRYMRHPDDDGPDPDGDDWPDDVSHGIAYGYSCAASLSEFQGNLNAHDPGPATITKWNQYKKGSKIGIHKSEYDVNTALCAEYIGIDCSAFIQRIALATAFTEADCSDLAGTRITRALPEIGTRNATNGAWSGRLATGSWNSDSYRRNLTAAAWRKQVVFAGDFINVPGSHIVYLDLTSRALATGGTPLTIWVYQACGDTGVPSVVTQAAVWSPTECTRRTIHSPLRMWKGGATGYDGNNASATVSRIMIWT